MTTPEHEAEAERVYRRTLGEVADSQVVAEAEDILCDTWIEELERFRSAVLEAAAVGGRLQDERAVPEKAAPMALHGYGLPIYGLPIGLDEACEVLAALDEELEHVCLVGLERTRRGREDLVRLRAAWLAAYGDEGTEQDG